MRGWELEIHNKFYWPLSCNWFESWSLLLIVELLFLLQWLSNHFFPIETGNKDTSVAYRSLGIILATSYAVDGSVLNGKPSPMDYVIILFSTNLLVPIKSFEKPTWVNMFLLFYFITSIHQYTNTSIHQYINTSIHQCINTPMHQYTNAPMHQYTYAPIHQYSNTSIHQCINTSIHQYINTWTHQYSNTMFPYHHCF